MNHAIKKDAQRAYMAAGSSEEDANDLGSAFALVHEWMNSLSDEKKREARAWMNEKARQTANVVMVALCLYGFLLSGKWDLQDRLHSESQTPYQYPY